MLTERLVHVGIVARNGGLKDGLRVIAVFAGNLSSIDCDLGDLALVCVVQKLGEADLLFLSAASCFDDDLPKEDEAGDHEDPDQNLFDGRVQSEFPHYPVCSCLEIGWS